MELRVASTGSVASCYGSPLAGVSLAAATERRGKPVRKAVSNSREATGGEDQLSDAFAQTFSAQIQHETQGMTAEFIRLRIA